MLLLDICDNGNILKVFRIIRVSLEIIRVIVPVLIIISVTISFFKALNEGTDDSFKEVFKSGIKKVIAGLLVFLAPTIIDAILGLASNDVNNVKACLDNSTEEGIQTAYQKEARKLLDEILKSYDLEKYDDVKTVIMKIDDDSIRSDYLKELDKIKIIIEINKSLDLLVQFYSDEGYEYLKNRIALVDNVSIRTELFEQLEKIKEAFSFKAEPGVYDLTFKSSSGLDLKYHLYIPNNATKDMPLIIYLHGDGHVGKYDELKNGGIWYYVKSAYGEEYPFIYIQPYTDIPSWTDGSKPEAVVELIKKIASDYKCDNSKIILTGSSRGGMGAWFIANKYSSMFSAFVPVVGTGNINASNFKDLPTRAYTTPSESDKWNYSNTLSNCNAINNAGGKCSFYSMSGYDHGSVNNAVYKKETFEWMISQ